MPYMDCMGLATCSKEVSYLSLMRSSKEKKQVIFGKKIQPKINLLHKKTHHALSSQMKRKLLGKSFGVQHV